LQLLCSVNKSHLLLFDDAMSSLSSTLALQSVASPSYLSLVIARPNLARAVPYRTDGTERMNGGGGCARRFRYAPSRARSRSIRDDPGRPDDPTRVCVRARVHVLSARLGLARRGVLRCDAMRCDASSLMDATRHAVPISIAGSIARSRPSARTLPVSVSVSVSRVVAGRIEIATTTRTRASRRFE
jgi:hypothetical protein